MTSPIRTATTISRAIRPVPYTSPKRKTAEEGKGKKGNFEWEFIKFTYFIHSSNARS